MLDDCATIIGCTRNSLSVVASEKGVVVGRVRFREAGDLIDCACGGAKGGTGELGHDGSPPHLPPS